MHLLIPHAGALSAPARQALATLDPARDLPRLQALLADWAPAEDPAAAPEAGAGAAADPEFTLTPPHERWLARHRGWRGGDGAWPVAAHLAREAGLPEDPRPAALLTPVHLAAGAEQVSLVDPLALALGEAESRALLDALRVLFEPGEGWDLAWAGPTRWIARHESLGALRTASLERVIGRNVDLWQPDQAEARALRRLLAEMQMLLHAHPVNDAREARGELPVNAVWLSGTAAAGSLPAAPSAPDPLIDRRLADAALAGDWHAWREAWRALDAGPLAALQAEAAAGRPARLTLAGEREARSFAPAPRPWWRAMWPRGRGADPRPLLEAL
jgi:hypothetical protein